MSPSLIERAILFGGKAVVAVSDTTDIVNEAAERHGLSALAAAALGRTLTMVSYMSCNYSEGEKVTAIIEGGGPLGRIIVSGGAGGDVRGYVSNGGVELPLNAAGKLDVGGGVGKKGELTVIKDIGMKEPYIGKCPLVSGEIAEEFAYYFTVSEQLPSGIALGVTAESGKVLSAGGVIVQPLPGCGENELVILEDIMRNFANISGMLKEKSAKRILEENFGHFEITYLPTAHPRYKCTCSREKIESLVLGMGESEALALAEEMGKINVHCEFCNTDHDLSIEDVIRLFKENNEES